MHRRRVVALSVVCVLGAGIGWLVVSATAGTLTGGRSPTNVTTPPGPAQLPSLVPIVPLETTFPGTLAPLPISAMGQSAVFVRGVGLMGASAHEPSVPIASVTKVMTAVLVLHDHPLGDGSGPTFTMTAADHSAWIHDSSNDDSNLDVVAGEHLTERQLLEALMIPSADNIADYLARWDAGSIPAFVKKMNALAAKLGMKHTHYADASGLNPDTRSTATDQATLGAYAMGIPGMVSIVDHPTMYFPVEGAVINYNPVVGQDGVIGLKSGFTSAAQGCLVTAARRTIGGHSVLIVSATLTQVLGLPEAGQLDLQLLNAASSALEARPVLRNGQPVAEVVAGWTHARPTIVVAGDPATVVGWAGLRVRTVVIASVRATMSANGWTTGAPMALVKVSTPGGLQSFAFGSIDGHLRPAPAGWSSSYPSGAASGPDSTSSSASS